MKTSKIKKRMIIGLIIVSVISSLFGTFAFGIENSSSKAKWAQAEEKINAIINTETAYKIISETALKCSSGIEEYTCFRMSPCGFAIMNNYSGSFEEITPYSEYTPYTEGEENGYFFGPGQYCVLNDGLFYRTSGEKVSPEELGYLLKGEIEKKANESLYSNELHCKKSEGSGSKGHNPETLTSSISHYITNSNYFTSLLGNDFGNNTSGTCTMVACAILLGYYDVYVNNLYVADQYRTGYGTTEAFHQLMISYINPSGGAAGLSAAKTGVNNYLATRTGLTATVEKVIGSHSSVYSIVSQKVNAGYPVVTAMFNSYNSNCPYDHTNITYGYTLIIDNGTNQCIEIYYHVHNGWKYSSSNLQTINYLWFADALYVV